ncbi:MAG TPA: glycosyltransferase family 87 protein [Vicinamibacterales bacterium]
MKSLDVRLPLVAAAVLAVIATIMAAAGRLPGEMRDFEVYWTAAARALEAEPLYRAGDGHYQFKYLPAFAVLTAPMALLPLTQAKAVWFVASAAMLPILIWLAVAILPQRHRSGWALVLIALVVMGKFYGHELVLGQVNLLFAVIATAALLLLRQRHDASAGLLFVAAVAVKPYAIIFLPWLAFVRGRRAMVASLAGLVVLVALPIIVYGAPRTLALHQEWWTTVSASTAPNLTNNDNVSVAGMFAKWLGAGRGAWILTLVLNSLLLIGAALVVVRGRGLLHREALEGALLLTLIPLLSPQGWDYVFLVATPAVVLLANDDRHLPRGLRWATWLAMLTIGLSLYDLLGRERYAAFMSWSLITVCFILLVASLAVLRLRRSA